MKNIVAQLVKLSSQLFGQTQIVFDVGSSTTRIGIYDKGIVMREPTYIGRNMKNNEYLFFGIEAKEIYGKAPNFIQVTKPIQNSVISDFDATVYLVDYFIKKVIYPFFANQRIFKSKLVAYTTVPYSSTEVEQKAIQEALVKAGVNKVSVIEKPLATGFGAGLPIFSSRPVFTIDLGGGLIEIAVITQGGIVAYKSLKNAGEYMDKLVYNYLHLKYGVIIGEPTAEHLKKTLFTLTDESKIFTIRGKSLENGLPKSVRVKSGDIKEALTPYINNLIDAIKELIESIPPEIIDTVIRDGITMSGGLAQIPGLDRYMATELKVPITIAKNPEDACVIGLMRLVNDKEKLDKTIIS